MPIQNQIWKACQYKTKEWNENMCDLKRQKYPNMDWNIYNQNISGARIGECTQWLHLSDAVGNGTITPLEAIDALNLGYVPEVLKTRESKYEHLL